MYRSPILIWWPDFIDQTNRLWKNFYHDFGSKKSIFFSRLLKNDAILRWMVNMGFLNAFRAPKSLFPAKHHISGNYQGVSLWIPALQNFFAVLKGGYPQNFTFLFWRGVSEKSLCVLCVRAQKFLSKEDIHRKFSAFGGLKGGIYRGGYRQWNPLRATKLTVKTTV